MISKDYISIAKCIVNARRRALDYYGFNYDDSNDMLMGINYVIDELTELFRNNNGRFDISKFKKALKWKK